MIISASRRTDIPACYGQWMMARLRAGEVLCRTRITRRVSAAWPFAGQCGLHRFWTKNAAPMLPLLDGARRAWIQILF